MEPARDVSLGKGGGGGSLTSLTHQRGEGSKEQGAGFVPETWPLLLSCSQQSGSFPPASGGARPLPGAPPRIKPTGAPPPMGRLSRPPQTDRWAAVMGSPFN